MLPREACLGESPEFFDSVQGIPEGEAYQAMQVRADPLERANLAASEPAVVAQLLVALEAYTANAYTGGLDKAKSNEDAYCEWIAKAGWVQPFE